MSSRSESNSPVRECGENQQVTNVTSSDNELTNDQHEELESTVILSENEKCSEDEQDLIEKSMKEVIEILSNNEDLASKLGFVSDDMKMETNIGDSGTRYYKQVSSKENHSSNNGGGNSRKQSIENFDKNEKLSGLKKSEIYICNQENKNITSRDRISEFNDDQIREYDFGRIRNIALSEAASGSRYASDCESFSEVDTLDRIDSSDRAKLSESSNSFYDSYKSPDIPRELDTPPEHWPPPPPVVLDYFSSLRHVSSVPTLVNIPNYQRKVTSASDCNRAIGINNFKIKSNGCQSDFPKMNKKRCYGNGRLRKNYQNRSRPSTYHFSTNCTFTTESDTEELETVV